MRAIRSFVRIVDSTNQWLGRIGIYGAGVIILIGTVEVIRRTVFNDPTHWGWELNSLILCVYIVLGGGYVTLIDGHIRMDVVYEHFSPRQKALVNVLLSFLFFAFTIVLLWHLWEMGWHSLMIREHDFTVWGPPLYPVKMLLPIAVMLVLLQGIARFIRDLHMIIRGEEL